MRSYLSWFMVALLALRGLLGDAMAMELLPTPVVAAISQSAHIAHPPHQAVPHAKGLTGMQMAAAPAAATAITAHPAGAHCANADATLPDDGSHTADDSACSSCLMCHTPGCTTHMLPPIPATVPGTRPAEQAVALASAPLRSPIKPPIA